MTKISNSDDDVVVEVSHQDVLEETINKLEERGFEPVLLCFRDSSGEIEILTRGGIKLDDFINWLARVWIPDSYDRHRDSGPGN